MLLELDPSPAYLYPVTLKVRTEDGVLKQVTVKLRFKRCDQDELAQMFDRYSRAIDPTLRERLDTAAGEGRLDEEVRAIDGEGAGKGVKRPIDAMRDEVRLFLVGWDSTGFVGGAEFSETNREKLLALPGAAAQIFYAFGDSIPVAEAKNSKR